MTVQGAADDSGRRLLTEALFKRVEVLGVQSVSIHPTPEADAHGWSEAFGPMPRLIPVEMVVPAIGRDGRGERARADTPSPSLIIPVTNVPSYVYREWRTA